jgi:hypothetical protein
MYGFENTAWPTQPPIQWVPERKAGHLALSSAEVKNAWSYASTPLYIFMTWCLINQAYSQFYLYLCEYIMDKVKGEVVPVLD